MKLKQNERSDEAKQVNGVCVCESVCVCVCVCVCVVYLFVLQTCMNMHVYNVCVCMFIRDFISCIVCHCNSTKLNAQV